MGKDLDRNDQRSLRLKNMIRVALGQSKMVSRPIAGTLHVIVYVGFILINIELLEIILDGLTGKQLLSFRYSASTISLNFLSVNSWITPANHQSFSSK